MQIASRSEFKSGQLHLLLDVPTTELSKLESPLRTEGLGDIKTFENFIVPLPAGTPLERYNTVVVWCEAFSQFITAAKYR